MTRNAARLRSIYATTLANMTDEQVCMSSVMNDVIEIFRSSFIFQAKTNAILYHENIEAQIDPTADFLAALGVSGKYFAV